LPYWRNGPWVLDGAEPAHLYVYNLGTGALLDNFSESGGTLNLQYWPSADQLAFSWLASHVAGGSGLRTLDTTGPATGHSAGALLADSTRVRLAVTVPASPAGWAGTFAW
jgi:hypothetical protein